MLLVDRATVLMVLHEVLVGTWYRQPIVPIGEEAVGEGGPDGGTNAAVTEVGEEAGDGTSRRDVGCRVDVVLVGSGRAGGSGLSTSSNGGERKCGDGRSRGGVRDGGLKGCSASIREASTSGGRRGLSRVHGLTSMKASCGEREGNLERGTKGRHRW